jgi:2-polyprenyl-6-methoxyphenol hydroxylase-like FAD-dependent oxidoreductase
MANVVVCGAGTCGLLTATLLAKAGHEVTVLERDAAAPPAMSEAWETWQRRGVNQFRLPHFLIPAFREMADREVPDLVPALESAGALRLNFLGPMKEFADPDGRFDTVTARRPILESVIAGVAEDAPGVTVRRGVALAGLLWGAEASPDVPHVRGIRTETGEEIAADLVIDAMGRRSPLRRWLADDGLDPGPEEVEDSGFIYYGCHVESDEPLPGPRMDWYGSVGVLCLPADNGTAGIGIIGWSGDTALRPLRQEATWRAALKVLPDTELILEARQISGMVSMAGIEDSRRRFVVEGRPVATGVVSVADAWAATNPVLGRGIAIGFHHACQLRDTIGDVGLDDPRGLVAAFDEVTQRDLGPWFDSTLWHDRRRLREVIAAAGGEPAPADLEWELYLRMLSTFQNDPALGLRFLGTTLLAETPNDILADPAVRDRLAEVATPPEGGPSRAEVLAAIAG